MLKGLQGAHPFELESTLREMREKVREWATPKLGHHVSSMHADYLDVLLNTIDLSDLLAKGGTASGCDVDARQRHGPSLSLSLTLALYSFMK